MADPAPQPGVVTDSKDIVQHLRTIHFSMIAACVGLYILVAAGRSPEFDEALAQLDQIAGVAGEWDEGWVQAAAADVVPETGFELEQITPLFRLQAEQPWTILPLPSELLKLAGHPETDPLDPEGPLWSRLREPRRWNPATLRPRRDVFVPDFIALTVPRPESPRDFETFWNGMLGTSLTVTVAVSHFPALVGPQPGMLENYPRGEPDADAVRVVMRLEPILGAETRTMWEIRAEDWEVAYHLVGYIDLAEPSIADLFRRYRMQQDEPALAQSIEAMISPMGTPPPAQPGRIETLAHVETAEHDLQSLFIGHAGVEWQPGSFAFNFPELSAVMAGNDALYIDKARAFIASQAKRSEGRISLFGFDVPRAMVSLWGGPLLLVAQFYFLLHLRSLLRCLNGARPAKLAPWIGVYDDPVAKATTAASALLLPPAALYFVVRSAEGSEAVGYGFVAASGALAVVTAAGLAGLWRRLA